MIRWPNVRLLHRLLLCTLLSDDLRLFQVLARRLVLCFAPIDLCPEEGSPISVRGVDREYVVRSVLAEPTHDLIDATNQRVSGLLPIESRGHIHAVFFAPLAFATDEVMDARKGRVSMVRWVIGELWPRCVFSAIRRSLASGRLYAVESGVTYLRTIRRL